MAGPLANARHELFAQEIVGGKTPLDAYVAAGFKPDAGNPSRLAARPEVKARIEDLLAGAAEKVEITKARVLAELGKIGFADIRKMFTDEGHLRRIEELDDDAAACLSAVEVITRRVPGSDRDDPEYENVSKIKLWDKRAALVDIGKHLGMFTEKVEHSGPNGGPIEMADTDLAKLIVFQLTKAAKQAD